MEAQLEYAWDASEGEEASDIEEINRMRVKKDISYMVINGCRTKELKSMIRVIKILDGNTL